MTVKIYKSKHGDFYFMNSPTNGLWSLSLEIPDLNTFQLCPCSIGYEEEKTAWDKGIELPADDAAFFNKHYKSKNNRGIIYNLIQSLYNISVEELDKLYNRYPKVMDLTKEIIKKWSSKHNCTIDWDYDIKKIYRDVKYYMDMWDEDKERVTKYMLERIINRLIYPELVMVDIFSECHPTKYDLLYEYYNCNDEEEKIMDDAVELFPDTKDIDKAYYYFKEKRAELYKR